MPVTEQPAESTRLERGPVRAQREPVAVEASHFILATAILMVVGSLIVVAVAIARGLALRSAIRAYLWGGLLFGALWCALMAFFAGGFWLWRRTRQREKTQMPELPPGTRVGGMRDAWVNVGRSQALTAGFLIILTLIQPKFAVVLAGFSLLGVGLLPVWAYCRSRATSDPAYIVSEGRRRKWYVRRSLARSP